MTKIYKYKSYIPIEIIFQQFAQNEKVAFLESSLSSKEYPTYSIIGRNPYLELTKTKTGQTEVNGKISSIPFEEYLDSYLKENQEENTTTLPLISGAIGYFSYEYHNSDSSLLPKSQWYFYDEWIIEDHQKQIIYLIANGKNRNAEISIQELKVSLNKLTEGSKKLANTTSENLSNFYSAEVEQEISYVPKKDFFKNNQLDVESLKNKVTALEEEALIECQNITYNFERADYLLALDQMIQEIIEGNIYIANMTQQIKIDSTYPAVKLYQLLAKKNPAPFAGFIRFPEIEIVSCSPENFIKIKAGVVTTTPIKGTVKRGHNSTEDEQLKQTLLNSEKDKSELLMIVDLERNDLNRICLPGSVTVPKLFEIESFATVHHLVAEVTGKLKPEVSQKK